MKRLVLLICIIAFNLAAAQTGKPAAKSATKTATKKDAPSDWDLLDEAFVATVDALQKGNEAAFKAQSLANVDCVDCVGAMEVTAEGTAFVPSGFFFIVISKNFTESPVYKAMAKKGYSFSTIVLENFRPQSLPKDGSKDLKLYEVWVETYKPGEYSKTHRGTSHSFRFVKVNGKFKFYGLTSIP